MIVGDGWGGDDGADLGEEIVEVVRLLDGVDDAAFNISERIAARGNRGDDRAHVGRFSFIFKNASRRLTRQAEVADDEANLVAVRFEKGDGFDAVFAGRTRKPSLSRIETPSSRSMSSSSTSKIVCGMFLARRAGPVGRVAGGDVFDRQINYEAWSRRRDSLSTWTKTRWC